MVGSGLALRLRSPLSNGGFSQPLIISSNDLFKLFSIFKLPLAFLTGLKIEKLKGEKCITSVRLKYLNKNPFRSTYFAVLSMAAELSTGAIALLAAEVANPAWQKLSLL